MKGKGLSEGFKVLRGGATKHPKLTAKPLIKIGPFFRCVGVELEDL